MGPLQGIMRATCEVAGHPEWEQAIAAAPPTEVAATFLRLLAGQTQAQTTRWWLDALRAVDVPVAEVLDLDGHLADGQVLHNGTYATATDPVAGAYRYARHPARWASGGERAG